MNLSTFIKTMLPAAALMAVAQSALAVELTGQVLRESGAPDDDYSFWLEAGLQGPELLQGPDRSNFPYFFGAGDTFSFDFTDGVISLSRDAMFQVSAPDDDLVLLFTALTINTNDRDDGFLSGSAAVTVLNDQQEWFFEFSPSDPFNTSIIEDGVLSVFLQGFVADGPQLNFAFSADLEPGMDVAEPETLALVGLGLFGLLAARRRRT